MRSKLLRVFVLVCALTAAGRACAGAASAWTVRNVALASSAAWYRIDLGNRCKGFEVRSRLGAALSLSSLSDGSAYWTVPSGGASYWTQIPADMSGPQSGVWVRSASDADTAEVIVYN